MKMKDKYRADSFTSDKGVTQPSGTWQIKCKKQHQKGDYKNAHIYTYDNFQRHNFLFIKKMYKISLLVCLN